MKNVHEISSKCKLGIAIVFLEPCFHAGIVPGDSLHNIISTNSLRSIICIILVIVGENNGHLWPFNVRASFPCRGIYVI